MIDIGKKIRFYYHGIYSRVLKILARTRSNNSVQNHRKTGINSIINSERNLAKTYEEIRQGKHFDKNPRMVYYKMREIHQLCSLFHSSRKGNISPQTYHYGLPVQLLEIFRPGRVPHRTTGPGRPLHLRAVSSAPANRADPGPLPGSPRGDRPPGCQRSPRRHDPGRPVPGMAVQNPEES